MNRARGLAPLLGGVLALLMACGTPRAQEEVDLGEVARAEAEAIEEARQAFEAADYPRTVLLIDRLLARGDAAAPAALASVDGQVEAEALRMRAIAYFNLARPDSARQDFRALIRLDAGHELDPRLTSPKVIALFEEVRTEMTGILKVDSAPPGAEVVIAGRRIGAAPIPGVRLLAGSYAVEVSKPGYDTASGNLEVRAGQVEIQVVTLTRNARDLAIITVPAGARVLVDGNEAGTTSGLAPASVLPALQRLGIPPASASAPLLVPGVRRGAHAVRAELACHEPFEAAVTVEDLEGDLPIEVEPIVLRESIGTLVLESMPSGAEVTLDGAPRGRTPLRLERMCAGEVSIAMHRQGTGVWKGRVGVTAGEETRISGTLRLTLASAGAVREPGVPDEIADAWDRFLADVLERQHLYHPIPLPTGPDLGPARIELYRRIQGDAGRAPALEAASRAALAGELGGDLILVAVPDGERSAELLLYFRDLAGPDRIAVPSPDAGLARSIAERLSRPTPLTAAWSGLNIVDGGEGGFPLVVDLTAGAGPAEGAVRVGDRLLALEGKPVTTRQGIEEWFSSRAPGERISVLVGRNTAKESAVITARVTPLIPHPGDGDALASKILADLSALRLTTEDGELRSFAALAMGTILLLRDEPRRAIDEGFTLARLPPRPGVSPATVDYLLGLAYERLGGDKERDAAREAFRRAAQDRKATLWRDDGPPLAPFAAARANRP